MQLKKVFTSLLLALCLILGTRSFGLPSIAASKQVVGENGGNVDSFDNFNTSVPLEVKVLDQSNRYAVDLEFEEMTITFSNSPTWNVGKLEYEFPTGTVVNNSFNVRVINHSDKAIGFGATAAPVKGAPLNIECKAENNVWRVPGLQSGDTEKIKEINVTATPTTGKWETVAEYGSGASASKISVGSVVVTIEQV